MFENYSNYLKRIVNREDLTADESALIVTAILKGELSEAQIGGFLTAMSCKGETVAEITGAARAMRKLANRVQVLKSVVVDTCGTGGDSLGTFNISTAAAFVVAGAGVTVAKHGNRSVSSLCGSADVLEKLGVNLAVDPEIVEEAVNEIGIGFMFAQKFHGAMKHAAPVRKQLGVRSMFNMLGPLTNPASASCQILGVFDPKLTEMFAGVLKELRSKRALIVHGLDGLDEISICASTRITELNDGRIKTYTLDPEQYFGQLAASESIKGGDSQTNAKILQNIYSGQTGPKRDIVLINAAGAIIAAGLAEDFQTAIEIAAESIDSGQAKQKLDNLVKFTQENA